MKTLSYWQDVNRLTMPLTFLRLRTGDEVHLCNRYADVKAAIDAREPFEAHRVVGMRPKAVVINPAHVALAEHTADTHETFTEVVLPVDLSEADEGAREAFARRAER